MGELWGHLDLDSAGTVFPVFQRDQRSASCGQFLGDRWFAARPVGFKTDDPHLVAARQKSIALWGGQKAKGAIGLDIADRWLTAGGLEHDGTELERVAFEGDLPLDRHPIGPVATASHKNQHHR